MAIRAGSGGPAARLRAEVSVESQKAEGDLRRFGNEVDRSANNQLKAADAARRHDQSLEKVGRGALVAGGVLAAGFGIAVHAMAGFEKEMSGVAAVSSASAEEMGRLREAALKAGADTVFSASQAAKAEAELAKAGVSTADILGGALRGSLDLAAAGQLDLAQASTIAAQSMNVFKLSGSDVGRIADVLAAGANKSAADVGQLGDALRQGGLLAAQTGLSLEDTVGALSAFADRALIGSDAGTSLKTMLQRLTPTSNEAAETMDRLGLRAYDAGGNFVGLQTYAGQLQRSLSGMSQEQRNAALQTIFGSDAVRAATVLYELGAAGVEKYTKAVDDQGAAARMSSTQLDNLSGDLEALKGSIETTLIGAGSEANGVLRFMAQSATDAVNAIGALPGPVQAAGMGFAGVAGAGLLAVGAAGTLIPKFREVRTELEKMGTAGAAASRGVGWLGRLSAGAAGAAAIVLAVRGLGEVIDRLLTRQPDIDALQGSLLDLAEGTGDVADVTDNMVGSFARFNAEWRRSEGNSEKRADVMRGFAYALDDVDQSLAKIVRGGAPNAAAAALSKISDAADIPVSRLLPLFDEYDKALGENAAQTKQSAAAAAEGQQALSGLEGQVDSITGALSENKAEASDWAKEVGSALSGFTSPAKAAQDALAALPEGARLSLQQFADELAKSVQAAEEWSGNLQKLAARGRGGLAAELAAMGPESAGLVAQAVTASDAELGKLEGLFSRRANMAGDAAGSALELKLGVLSTIAANKGNVTVDSLATALGRSREEVAAILADVGGLMASFPPEWTTKLKVQVEIAQGIQKVKQFIDTGDPAHIAGVNWNLGIPDLGNYTPMAVGAIVDKPTLALIGEKAREVVAPTDDPRRAFELLTASGLINSMMAAGYLGGRGDGASAVPGRLTDDRPIVIHSKTTLELDRQVLARTSSSSLESRRRSRS